MNLPAPRTRPHLPPPKQWRAGQGKPAKKRESTSPAIGSNTAAQNQTEALNTTAHFSHFEQCPRSNAGFWSPALAVFIWRLQPGQRSASCRTVGSDHTVMGSIISARMAPGSARFGLFSRLVVTERLRCSEQNRRDGAFHAALPRLRRFIPFCTGHWNESRYPLPVLLDVLTAPR